MLWVQTLVQSGHNNVINPTSTALLRLRLNATLAQTNQLRPGGL